MVETKMAIVIRHTLKILLITIISTKIVIGESVRNDRDTQTASAELQELSDLLERMKEDLGLVARQTMMQQFYNEEKSRSNGDSGIKTIRNVWKGFRPYQSATHTSYNTILSIHDHANNLRTLGLGEFVAVLNGVEFRTRHNDYPLKRKHKTSTKYGATEDITYPPVPPEVTQKTSVEEQIAEMKEFFLAFKNQDTSHRDYRPYFRPVLVYLEGAWTLSDQAQIEESFFSDRHHLDAKTWLDMQDKIRFTSYTGRKDGLENFAYLPTTIISINNKTTPLLAQWNFKILGHPLKGDLPLNKLNLIDDPKTRAFMKQDVETYAKSRAARFQLNAASKDKKFVHKALKFGLLDELMAEVPGPDGYQGSLNDTSFDQVVYPIDRKATEPLNVAYYNRAYRVKELGAQGTNGRHRGVHDRNLFVAKTSQPKIAELSSEKCVKDVCKQYSMRVSYASPLEIVYMTPLSTWNPYDIVHKGFPWTAEGKTVVAGPNGARNGGSDSDKAYNGTHHYVYYRTPSAFFHDEKKGSLADTTRGFVHVLDSKNNVRKVQASGIRIFLPDIPGVGSIRQRYPIPFLHGEGSSVWKNQAALVDMLMDPTNFRYLHYNDELPVTGRYLPNKLCMESKDMCALEEVEREPYFLLKNSKKGTVHSHEIKLSDEEIEAYNSGKEIEVRTDVALDHIHVVTIKKRRNRPFLRRCDGKWQCPDRHPKWLGVI